MITTEAIQHLMFGQGHVVGEDGKRIGTMGQVFLDAATGQPAWVTVKTGLFGTAESFVPLEGATAEGDDLVVPFHKDQVKHAPRIESAEGRLTPEEERELYRHYAVQDHDAVQDTAAEHDDDAPVVDDARADTHVQADDVAPSGSAEHDDATGLASSSDGMTLSRERAKVIGTERVPTERVRLVRYTVTEERQVEVPVLREEYRLEYDTLDPAPDRIDPDDQPSGGPGHASGGSA